MNLFNKELQSKEKYIGENDLYLEIYEPLNKFKIDENRPPLIFLHGAWCGSWMWYKYITHFINDGWKCYVMNLRSHYKSRSLDIARVNFYDYVEDLNLVIDECKFPPIVIGHSIGALIAQKSAEKRQLSGLVSVDTTECKEINDIISCLEEVIDIPDVVVPPRFKLDDYQDRTEKDIKIMEKYFSIESGLALRQCAVNWTKEPGISVNRDLINCKVFVIKAINNTKDKKIGIVAKEYFNADYVGFENITHSGLLIGKRYVEVVQSILTWIDQL